MAETNTTLCNLQSLEWRVEREENDEFVHELVVAIKEFAEEEDMRFAEATELQRSFEHRLELLREWCFQVENEVHDNVQKLGAVQKEHAAADDDIIAFEKKKFEWDDRENHLSRTGTTLSALSQTSTLSPRSQGSETLSTSSDYFQTI